MSVVRRKQTDLPPTKEQQKRLEALSREPDETIDYSDIPRMSDKEYLAAVKRGMYRPVKTQVSIRIDADVLEWLRGKSQKYQTKANEILREAMLKDKMTNKL